jgi:uncharacterized membrane protein YfcA
LNLSFSLPNAILLFCAALFGGAINAVAGGGSFISFPTLLFTGVPAVPANATNTVALWTGLVFSGGAFRHHLNVRRRVWVSLVSISLAGGVVGALLLLRTPAHTFLKILPWLMLSATLIFIFAPRFTKAISKRSNPGDAENVRVPHNPSGERILAACCLQLLVAVYGGYFGGGMGFVILAMLSAFGMADTHEMNAFKVVLSSAINGLAVIVFIVLRAVYWPQAAVMICGAALGGYFGARYSLRLPQKQVRWAVITVGVGMTAYFFLRAY